MALTRKMLKAMGIEDEKIDEIIDAHREVTDSLKADRDKYKADAEKLTDIQSELDEANKKLEGVDTDEYKAKYEKEHKDFEDYKKGIEAEKTQAKKKSAYRELLKETGVSDKRIDVVLRATVLDDIELDADGKIKDADKVTEKIKADWSDFIVTEGKEGAGTETPPDGKGGSGGRELSRAAMVAKRHNEMLYGVKGDK